MSLKPLFLAVADVLDGELAIEQKGREALLEIADQAGSYKGETSSLPNEIINILESENAHTCCRVIAQTPLLWVPPQTSSDPLYIEHSLPKVHVELLGPDGLVKSDKVRLGLYGMLSGHEYGIRTHLAEEVFVMLAGQADWKTGEGDYQPLTAGDRSWHPSMFPHASKTRDSAFMSVYVWSGDISTTSYVYQGIK